MRFLMCILLFSFAILSKLILLSCIMSVKEKIKSHPDLVDYFKELPFYNKKIQKPKIKRLKNIDLLSELPFYEELNVIRTNHAFGGYAMSYKVELVEKKSLKQAIQVFKTCLMIF